MRDDYHAILAAIHQATETSVAANAQLIASNMQLIAIAQSLADAMRAARDEHEDMRQTIQRLEALVTDLQRCLDHP